MMEKQRIEQYETGITVKNEDPIRVLHIGLNEYPGGLSSFVMNIYRNIDRNKVQFDFLSIKNEPLAYENEIHQMGGHVYKELYRIKNHPFRHILGLKKFFKTHANQFKGIHLHVCGLSFISPLWYAKKNGVPLRIIHSHQAGDMQENPSALRKALNRKHLETLGAYATHFLACSQRAGEWMYKGRYPYVVIPNAIDIAPFRFNPTIRKIVREELDIGDKFTVGVVGRFDYQKNPEYTVKIFEAIMEMNKNSVLLWIGDGEEFQTIQNKVKKLGLDSNTKFLGIRNDVARLYQAMDVFLLPSRFEGLPFVGIEAQAAGLPCFFSSEITKEADVTGNIQFLSIKATPRAWAEAIIGVKNKVRTDYSEQIIASGYELTEMSKKMETLYYDASE